MKEKSRSDYKELYSGLVRLHVLHHACAGPVYGNGLIEELARHGYKISAGTLYPILHGLEGRGLIKAVEDKAPGNRRRSYRATRLGRQALKAAKEKVKELFAELFQVGEHSSRSRKR